MKSIFNQFRLACPLCSLSSTGSELRSPPVAAELRSYYCANEAQFIIGIFCYFIKLFLLFNCTVIIFFKYSKSNFHNIGNNMLSARDRRSGKLGLYAVNTVELSDDALYKFR